MTIETKATLNSNSRVNVTVNGGCKETLKGAAETAVWNRDCKEVTILRQDGKNYTVKTEIPEEYQDKAIKALVKVIKAFAHGEIDSNEVKVEAEVEAEVETAEVEMPKISAKQVADAKATMELIQTRINNNEISDTELNSAVDRYNAAKAIVAASETTAEQIGLTINTALTNGKVSLKLDGNKISMANAFKAALAQDKAIVLRNEVGDFCIIDRDDDILTLGEFNFKTAIRQFANGEKVQGSTVMNKHQVHVIKAAQVEAQPEAEVEVETEQATTARFTKEELATEFEIGNAEERYNAAKELVRYRVNAKGTKCWSIWGEFNAKTGWHSVKAEVADRVLVNEVGITLIDFLNMEEYMNEREQKRMKNNAEVEAQPEVEVKAAEVKADLSAPLARLAEVKVKVDRANEEHLKLSFAVHVSIHFYLNDLKSELFNKHIFPNQDRVREMLNPELDAIYDELVAVDHLNGCDEYGELLDYCVKTAATGSSNAVRRQARNIADEIENKLGEQALADELKKIVDEYGISRDLLFKSGDCDFNPALFAEYRHFDAEKNN